MEVKNEQTLVRILNLIEKLITLRIGKTAADTADSLIAPAAKASFDGRAEALKKGERDREKIEEINARLKKQTLKEQIEAFLKGV